MKENTTCSHCGAAILSVEESRSFDGQILCEECFPLANIYLNYSKKLRNFEDDPEKDSVMKLACSSLRH